MPIQLALANNFLFRSPSKNPIIELILIKRFFGSSLPAPVQYISETTSTKLNVSKDYINTWFVSKLI